MKLLTILIVSVLTASCFGQAWSGIIDSTRAIDWTLAGVSGGIPSAAWTQCGATVAAYSGTCSSGGLQAAINACGANQYVQMGAGTFTLSDGCVAKSNMAVRGMGATSTFIVMTGYNGCGGDYSSFMCVSLDSTWAGTNNGGNPGSASIRPSGDGGTGTGTNQASWTAGYTQGATSITLTSVGSNAPSIGQYIYLDQRDTNTTSNNLFICDDNTTPCSLEGGAPGRFFSAESVSRNQIQMVKVTNISGSTYTISPGLYGINWSSGLVPGAWWATTDITHFGVENLSIDSTSSNGAASSIAFFNANNSWVKGVRSIYNICSTNCANGRNHINLHQSANITVQDSYFYGTIHSASESYGVESFISGNNLIQNNIFQYIAAPLMMGPSTGSVIGYNFSINDYINLPTFLSEQDDEHDAGVLYNLFEGNIGAMFYGDVFHGTGGANTFFRNRWNGNECTGGTCNTGGNYAIRLDSYNRVENSIGNVLGTTGVHSSYKIVSPTTGAYGIYYLNHGNTEGAVTVPSDSLTSSTLMLWGNYDTVTNAVRWCGNSSDPGWSTTCASTSEVPTGIGAYANAVPSSTTLPASFAYSSEPSFLSGKPWPLIGPDVASGNIGTCGPAGNYRYAMALSSGQCTGTTFTASSPGGYSNSNPAMDCYLNTMSGPTDGTGSVLTFNPTTCYSQGGGTVTASPSGDFAISCLPACVANYTGGTVVTLTETPVSGHTFSSWSGGGCSGSATACVTTMSADQVVTATFVAASDLLTVIVSGTGTVTASPVGDVAISCPTACSANYATGTVVTLTETPGIGQVFSSWSGGGCSGSATTCAVTMSSPLSVTATFVASGGGGEFSAQEPTSWQDPTICNPVGGIYDQTIVIDGSTSVNNGPNNSEGGTIGVSKYQDTIAGLNDAVNNWRDNGANTNGGNSYTDANWIIKVPSGTLLHGSTYASNNALVSLPGKINAGVEPSKCLTIDSTTPLPSYTVTGAVTSGTFTNGERVRQTTSLAEATLYNAVTGVLPMQLGPMYGYPNQTNMYTWVGQTSSAVYTPTSTPNRFMVCGRGLPGLGGTRNQGCDGHVAGPNDRASLWKLQMDVAGMAIGRNGIHQGADPVTPANWTNHIVLRNVEITLAPGAAQSAAGSPAPGLFTSDNSQSGVYVFGVGPTLGPVAKHIGLENYYLHGWDPGDPGQPSGACAPWAEEGYVTVAPDGGGVNSTVTWKALFSSSLHSYFGMTFTPGSIINIGGTNYTIANTTLTQNVLNGLSNTLLSIVGTVTFAANTLYTQLNPPAQYAHGCGDDVAHAVSFSCDNCWREGGYIEKIHHWNAESKTSSQGFDKGTVKEVMNWEEGSEQAWFMGGAAIDVSGGPGANYEVRKNFFAIPLPYRQLSANASNSPAPPWGCGTADGIASHNTCPFLWSIKNPLEMKIGNTNLFDGNIIDGSWSDGQTGFCALFNAEADSGGAAAGIFDQITGFPISGLHDIRFSNNWLRNCPQLIQMANRSSGQTQNSSNGGGISLSSYNMDWVNNLGSNIGDIHQFGNPGDQWQWVSGGQTYPCTMSYTGSGPYTVAAQCIPETIGMRTWVTKISKDTSGVVTITKPSRTDPILCLTTPTDCITKGFTATMSGAPSVGGTSFNGTFAISGTTGNWFADGTGGTNVIYTDNINPVPTSLAVLCDNTVPINKCSALSYTLSVASLGAKMTDICAPGVSGCSSQGDGVYVFDYGGGDTTCTADGYAAGATSATYAVAGTLTLGLTVKYSVTSAPTLTQPNPKCLISNRSGGPKNATVRNNTFLSPNIMAITTFAKWYQSVLNTFNDNIFVTNDAGNRSDFYCNSSGGGVGALSCFDNATLEFYHNVFAQQNPSNWTGAVVNCPSGPCVHSFPAAVNCATATADATCLGFSGFMGPAPTVAYPTGSCAAANAPFNCPLMALPWANNFTLDNLTPVGSSVYSTQGVNIPNLKTAMTQSQYVCTGSCGDGSAGHHPYPD
jgi:Divergent InlB B-repeat domain